MAGNCTNVAVVMVPFPEYGHLTPLLRLSRLISLYDIPVHYATIGARNHELKIRLKDWKLDQFPNIHFHDLSGPPTNKNTCSDDEEDDALALYYLSLVLLADPLCTLCRELSSTFARLVIIHDAFMLECVQVVHQKLTTKLETYIFHAVPAFTTYSWIQQGIGNNSDDLLLPLEAHIPSIKSSYPPEFPVFIKMLRDWTCKSSGEIFNTCKEIEDPYLDALAKQSEKPVWGLGPFNPVHVQQNHNSHRCIEWLDKQPKHSVIYVSFGTVASFSPEQINELATGLEQSEQKFIWVLRSRDKKGNYYTTDIPKIELPPGFEERVAERGIVARDWVPQLEILAHPSTGGYLFHSGWNSFLESATLGVPMATWPMHADNPFNDVLITKVLKVGVVVRDWACRDKLVKSSTIESALKTLMTSPEGEEMRQRAIDLSKAIKMSMRDGGATQQMESFINHITR